MSVIPDQEPEVIVYREVLKWSGYLGLVFVLVTFSLYASGLVDPYIPLSKLHNFWVLNVREYVEAADIETGWGWVGMLQYADFFNFLAIAFLSSVTVICYIAIIPILLRNGKDIYAVLAILEVIVLTVAASGVLGMA